MKFFTLLAILLVPLFSLPAQAQGVTIGAAGAPDASAALEVRTTTQGLLLPRLTITQREAIANPAAGLLVYQADDAKGVYYFDGTSWRNMTDGTVPQISGPVSTPAGSGAVGTANGPGATAQFNGLTALVCANGAIYVVDQDNSLIRRLVMTPGQVNGSVGTLAGSGTVGTANGNPSTAQFYNPRGVAFDGNITLYVCDQATHRIRTVSTVSGFVNTLAGGTVGYVDGPGATARFSNPYGVAYDGNGNLYVADWGNHRIRKIVAATGVVSTLAGSGTAGFADGASTAAQFNFPTDVACDASGNVYVADGSNHRIRKIVAATGAVSTLAGSGTVGYADGAGATARFNNPSGLTCDASGNVYVADYGNNVVRKIVAATGVASTLAGSGTAGYADGPYTTAQFNRPTDVACDANGNVYVTDYSNNRIRLIK